jgi:hypothetical protein
MRTPERALAWLLRAVGVLDLCALDAPIVSYLTRSASSLYALYGALLLYLASDVVRYLGVVRFLALAAQAHALVLVVIDLNAGLPPWWIAAEGTVYLGWSGAVLWLVRRTARANG